jgi:hypothetical protein
LVLFDMPSKHHIQEVITMAETAETTITHFDEGKATPVAFAKAFETGGDGFNDTPGAVVSEQNTMAWLPDATPLGIPISEYDQSTGYSKGVVAGSPPSYHRHPVRVYEIASEAGHGVVPAKKIEGLCAELHLSVEEFVERAKVHPHPSHPVVFDFTASNEHRGIIVMGGVIATSEDVRPTTEAAEATDTVEQFREAGMNWTRVKYDGYTA